MNRTEAKELLPVITAFAEGADVEFRNRENSATNRWLPIGEPSFVGYLEYRIAPKPKTCERWCFLMFLHGHTFWYSLGSEAGALARKSEIARANPDATFSQIVRVEFVEEKTA